MCVCVRGGKGGAVILGENISRWGEVMTKFLASGGHMSDLTKICSKTTFMKNLAINKS